MTEPKVQSTRDIAPLSVGETDRIAVTSDFLEDKPGLRRQHPVAWWLSVALLVLGFADSLLLSTGTVDLASRLGELTGDGVVVGLITAVIYWFIHRTSSSLRSKFLVIASAACAAVWISHGNQRFEELHKSAESLGSILSQSAKTFEDVTSGKEAENKPIQSGPTSPASPDGYPWMTEVGDAATEYTRASVNLISKYRSDVAGLGLGTMLTPAILLSTDSRNRNRQNLLVFNRLLSTYAARSETLAREYRQRILSIKIPATQREGFVKEFEHSFAETQAANKKLSDEESRVERRLAATILSITDLFEMERDRVELDTEANKLKFANPRAADQYNSLLTQMRETAAEEAKLAKESADLVRANSERMKGGLSGYTR